MGTIVKLKVVDNTLPTTLVHELVRPLLSVIEGEGRHVLNHVGYALENTTAHRHAVLLVVLGEL